MSREHEAVEALLEGGPVLMDLPDPGRRLQLRTSYGLTRARFGFTAAPGSTGDPRLRRITEHLPPTFAARLFEAHQAGSTERQLELITAEGLQEMYFTDRGRRARDLTVDFTNLDYIELGY
ncbi:hypothetical protein GCM10009753_30890 [Streptantibioticus ferralitis]